MEGRKKPKNLAPGVHRLLSPQAVTASVAVTANLDCTVHCLHVPKGAAQPSASAVVEAAHGHTRCTAHAACVVRLGDLVPDTDYDVYCAARLSQWPQSPSAHTTTVHGPAELTTGSLAFTAAPEVFGVTASSVKVRAALSITNASLRCAAVTPSSLDPLPESWIEYADRADHKICLAGAMCEVCLVLCRGCARLFLVAWIPSPRGGGCLPAFFEILGALSGIPPPPPVGVGQEWVGIFWEKYL